jgi:hypothetical protein
MYPGTQMTAFFRNQVADMAIKYNTLNEAIASIPAPKNRSEELTRHVLISFLEDEYKPWRSLR